MSSQYALQQLATLDISKATGLDNISVKFLKMSEKMKIPNGQSKSVLQIYGRIPYYQINKF
jgi:hypothetical protein